MDTSIELLVFSAQNLLFGAYAGQVAEVAHSSGRYAQQSDDGLFFFVHRAERSRGIDFASWLHRYAWQKEPDFVEQTERPFSSTLLLIHSLDCVYRAVWVDEVEEFLTTSLDCLYTLPVFMQQSRHALALWGFVRQKNRLIPLIDLSKLLTA